MNIIIIEDEAPALARVQKLVREVDSSISIVGTADSIESAVVLFKQHSTSIDLALMDIELADGQSFEIFERVEVTCPVIFTTAYDEFALKAFKVSSIDYLLKPIDIEELKRAFNKLKMLKQEQGVSNYQQLQSLLSSYKPELVSYKNRFLIKIGTRMISVPVDQIAYFHAMDKLVYIYTVQGQRHVIDYTLDELLKVLDPALFFQLNRKFVANMKSIQSVHNYFNGKLKVELRPVFEEEVIVSRDRAAEFKQWLDS